MKHINQRNIRLVDELMCFCYKYGAKDIQINVIRNDDETTILVKAHINSISPKTLTLANELLSVSRCHEMEEYYWNLSGDDDTDTELTLVGMMTDEAEIDYYEEEKILEIKVKRFI